MPRVERDSYPVSSRLEGTIAKIYVSNGQLVRAGDLLVEMDHRQPEAALSRYSEAKTAFGDAIDRVRSDQESREVAAAKLRAAESVIAQTERQLGDVRVYATVNGRVAFDKSKVNQRLRPGETFLRSVEAVAENPGPGELKTQRTGLLDLGMVQELPAYEAAK